MLVSRSQTALSMKEWRYLRKQHQSKPDTVERSGSQFLPKELETAGRGEYSNNVEYLLYVNFGHRLVIKGKTVGYIPGKFFLEAGVEHMKRNLDRYFASEIKNIRGNWK